ncbi:MAG: hypothetical protein HYS22_01670 [Deltaproteobacteria bacterium]|nr:hypothetical protein [Deltaproteobacteria bacterium]
MKKIISLAILLGFVGFSSCSSSSSDDTTTTEEATEAATYAVFGEALNNQVPAGLKIGTVSSSLNAFRVNHPKNALSGTCSSSYTDCPSLTASGGADSMAGEILSRLWGLDYNNECTDAFLADGTCFNCTDCSNGSVGSKYIKPTVLADPKSCATISTTAGHYVNFGVDPCFFDSMIAKIENVKSCVAIRGEEVSIVSAIPWYASWGIPQTIAFSGFQKGSDATDGFWWTVNQGSAEDQYFVSLNSNWLYGGIRNKAEDRFLFFATGSPAYYAGRGEGSGINVAGYAGSLSASTQLFEAIQIRDQAPNSYINRLKSNGSYLWAQYWQGTDFPATPTAAETVKNSPTETRCVQIGTSISTSKYVPLATCVASFGAASVAELNQDSGFTLKIVDGQTAGSIDFATPLTAASATSCATAKK